MKTFPAILLQFLGGRSSRRNLLVLGKFLLVLWALIALYSVIFHYLMAWEGQQYSWVTGAYWTLTVMSTLGFGDITFQTDTGRLFSMVVLLTGMLFMLTLLPFTFIQFFYAPWMEAQAAARTPRQLPKETTGHVLLTHYDPLGAALIKRLDQYQYRYTILVADAAEAARLYDQGLKVAVGDIDDPETYRKMRVEHAALIAATGNDVVNTNVAFTAREVSSTVPIVATAMARGSVDILELAGCTRVLRLAEMMGQAIARRVLGRDAKSHVIGRFDELLIAEASAADTPLVGRTLRDIRLRDHVNVTVAGVWERGRFQTAGPETLITSNTVLVLAGSREQLEDYDGLFCIYRVSEAPILIVGGGRVGSAAAAALGECGIDYRVVEKNESATTKDERYIWGDASDLETLEKAGIGTTPVVVITTHYDDLNVYLTLYCRRLRSDIQIISRATHEQNVQTLHRAGADSIISESSIGAGAIFNLLKRSDILLLAEGLHVFKVPVPRSLVGKSLAQTDIRRETECSVIAIAEAGGLHANPDPNIPLPEGAEMVLIGAAESEERFLDRYVRR